MQDTKMREGKMDYSVIKEQVDKIKGSTFISMDTLTEVKLTGGKKNPLQGRVQKLTTGANVMVFNSTEQNGYENMIKRRMLEEGKDPSTFTLGVRPWGTRIDQSPFIDHNGKKYIECVFMNSGKTVYLVDGVDTPKDDIEGLPEVKENPDSQGGIENKVIIRTFAVDSIQSMRINGVELV
jgi:hypothetical protein